MRGRSAVGMRGWLPTDFIRGYRPCGNTPPSRRGYIQRANGAMDYKFHLAFRQMKHSFMRRQAPISSSAGTSIYSLG